MIRLAIVALLMLGCFAGRAPAQSVTNQLASDPVLLTADEIVYDEATATVTASGDVEISSGERVLLADQVNYRQTDGIVTASGHVSVLEPTGEVLFADHVELDAELKTGFVESVSLLLSDKSRFAASRGDRYSENRFELTKAVYSPCNLCKEDPDRAPLWQIKASRVVHRRQDKSIEYRDAFLEIYGVPIAYVPYFQHPDPSVKRKSGLLAPSFGSSSDLGLTVHAPFYYAISPQRDLTLTPIYTAKEGPVLATEYRALTQTGGYELDGSITRPHRRDDDNQKLQEREIRGHIKTQGRFDLEDNWRWGFDLYRATDDTYLRRYDIANDDTLTSDLFVEGFNGTRYASASAYLFQGLRINDDPGETPAVAPLLEYSGEFQPLPGGLRLGLDSNLLNLQRSDGLDTRRLSVDTSLTLPYIGQLGDVWTLDASLSGEAYWLDDYANPGRPGARATDGFESRLYPQVALDVRYPLIRSSGTVRQVVEPIAQVILAPYGGNPASIPNEDSQSVEFDDTNLFSLERFPGDDRVESGHRAKVGIKLGAYGASGGYTTAVLGQVFRLRDDDTFAAQTGLDDQQSDYVASLTIAPSELLDLTGRIRVDREKLALRRNEVYLAIGPPGFRFVTTYVKLNRDQTIDTVGDREEMYNRLLWKLTPEWTATAESRRDLTGDGDQLFSGVGLIYQDECIGIATSLRRRFTHDRDVQPSTSFNIRFILRNLG